MADVVSYLSGGSGTSQVAGATDFGIAVVMETTTTLRRRPTVTLLVSSSRRQRHNTVATQTQKVQHQYVIHHDQVYEIRY